MSNFKNKLLSMSGEITRENEMDNINEDHKMIVRNVDLEARLQEAFAKIMRDIQNFEYSLGGYMSLPYGKTNPAKVIEQARNNELQYKKLKRIAYERMEELKQVIDEVLCPDEYEEKKSFSDPASMSSEVPTNTPSLEVEVGTTTNVGDELGDAAYYSKRTKSKKKKSSCNH